jgi:hypothetical protein
MEAGKDTTATTTTPRWNENETGIRNEAMISDSAATIDRGMVKLNSAREELLLPAPETI